MKPSVEKLYFGENPMDFGTFTLPESGCMGVVQSNFQRLGMKYNDKIKKYFCLAKLFFRIFFWSERISGDQFIDFPPNLQ